jgi:hypothetical protein
LELDQKWWNCPFESQEFQGGVCWLLSRRRGDECGQLYFIQLGQGCLRWV